MYYSMKEYKFIDFYKSMKKDKKYYALLENKKNKSRVKVHFGSKAYDQYKDSTGKGFYTHKNHLDEDRKKRYIARHRGFIRKGYYSPGWLSLNFLWK